MVGVGARVKLGTLAHRAPSPEGPKRSLGPGALQHPKPPIIPCPLPLYSRRGIHLMVWFNHVRMGLLVDLFMNGITCYAGVSACLPWNTPL